MTTHLIGLIGAAGAGKDTVGNYLADRHDYQPMAFADPIRDMLVVGLGLTRSRFLPENKERPIEALGGRSPRDLMLSLGCGWGRHMVAPDLWCRMMESRLERHWRFVGEPVVITDVRFPDEAELVRRRGGALWRIERPGAARSIAAGHISETAGASIPVDRVLHNGGTPEVLYELVDAIIEEMLADGAAAEGAPS